MPKQQNPTNYDSCLKIGILRLVLLFLAKNDIMSYDTLNIHITNKNVQN